MKKAPGSQPEKDRHLTAVSLQLDDDEFFFLAARALVRVPIGAGLMRLDARNPHGPTAIGTERSVGRLRRLEIVRFRHPAVSFLGRRERDGSLSHRRPGFIVGGDKA